MIYSNKGMYLEDILNRTISYYRANNICYFEKRSIPFKFIKKIDEKKFIGCLQSKSTVDYFGFANKKHIEFEAKETSKDYFRLSLIAKHQYEWMELCIDQGIGAYIVLLFSKYDHFFIIPFEFIREYKRFSKISYGNLTKKFTPEEIIFPGIVNFIKKM